MALSIFIVFAATARSTETIEILGQDMRLIVAKNSLSQTKGLSGISREDFLAQADGMLFTFKDQKERTFWMKGMEFNIDIVWLRDGKVMKVETSIPAPEKGEEPRKIHSAPFEVDTVLELPEGGAYRYGIVVGQMISVLER